MVIHTGKPLHSSPDFGDDGRHSEVSYYSNVEHLRSVNHGQMAGQITSQDANNMPFEFQQPVHDHTTHFVNKTPMEDFLTTPGPWTGFGPNANGVIRNLPSSYADFAHLGAFGRSVSEGGNPHSDEGYQTGSAGTSGNHNDLFPFFPNTGHDTSVEQAKSTTTPTKPKSNRPKGEHITCPTCRKEFTCRSDYSKHERTHTKPYICYEPDCKRGLEGFTTANDLGRHTKSCHTNGIDGKSKSWRCVGINCKDPSKVWPRYDNFKQHVVKMHSTEDWKDVVQRSEINPGVTSEADSNCAQVVNPANLSKAVISAPGPPTIVITPEPNSASSNFTPINDEDIRLINSSASPVLSNITKTSALPSRVPTTPSSNSNSSKDPPLSTDEQPSLINRTEMPGGDLPKSTSELDEPVDELKVLTSLLRSISNALDLHNNPSSTSRKFELYGQIRTAVMRLPDEFANHEDSIQGDQEVEVAEGGQQQCSVCGKMIKRTCDMRKHMKRHTRPYGCTWSNCNGSFGSKNDWKRHESTQHCITDLWKCSEQSAKTGQMSTICGQAFNRRTEFEKHLVEEHNFVQELAGDKADHCHISRNSHCRYWCGFCEKLQMSEERGSLIINERYTHVADHFTKEGKSIKDWIDVVAHKKKRDMPNSKLSKFQNSGVFSPDPLIESQPSQTSTLGTQVQQNSSLQAPMMLPQHPVPRRDAFSDLKSSSSRKRTKPEDAEENIKGNKRRSGQKADQPKLYWICCGCNYWNTEQLTSSCVQCSDHRRCPNCAVEEGRTSS